MLTRCYIKFTHLYDLYILQIVIEGVVAAMSQSDCEFHYCSNEEEIPTEVPFLGIDDITIVSDLPACSNRGINIKTQADAKIKLY